MVEDTVHEQIERVLRSRGWGNRVITHVGYGSPSFVRVFARILLGRKGRESTEGPESRHDATGALSPAHYDRGWSAFLTSPATGVPVKVTAGNREIYGRSDRGGHVDIVARDHGLGPGWQQEHWTLGPGRKGYGAHRNWLTWVSTNHLHSLMSEGFDPELFKKLSSLQAP